MAGLPKITQLPQQQITQPPLVPIVPIVKFPVIGVTKPKTPNESLVFDYNDPNQLNSAADIFRRNVARIIESDNILNKAANVLFGWIPMAKDALDLTKRSVAPLFDDDPRKTMGQKTMGYGINMLINFGETMDILANPIKGAFIDGWEGVRAASQGKNYDFDTGNIVTDILAESAVDPLNWASLGVKNLASMAAKGAVRTVVKGAGFDLAERGVNRLSRQLISGWKGSLAATVDDVFVRKLDDAAVQLLRKAELDKRTVAVLNALTPIHRASDAVESALFKMAINTGAAYSPLAFKFLMNNPATKFAVNQLNQTMVKYNPFKKLDTVSFHLSLPEVQLRLESIADLEDRADLGEYIIQQGNAAIQNDLDELTDIFADLGKAKRDIFTVLKDIKTAINMKGYSYDEYREAVRKLSQRGSSNYNLRQLNTILEHVDEVRLNAIRIQESRALFEHYNGVKAGIDELFSGMYSNKKFVIESVSYVTQALSRGIHTQQLRTQLNKATDYLIQNLESVLPTSLFNVLENRFYNVLDYAINDMRKHIPGTLDYKRTTKTYIDTLRQMANEAVAYDNAVGMDAIIAFLDDIGVWLSQQSLPAKTELVLKKAIEDASRLYTVGSVENLEYIQDALNHYLDSLLPDLSIHKQMTQIAQEHIQTVDIILRQMNTVHAKELLDRLVKDGIAKQRKIIIEESYDVDMAKLDELHSLFKELETMDIANEIHFGRLQEIIDLFRGSYDDIKAGKRSIGVYVDLQELVNELDQLAFTIRSAPAFRESDNLTNDVPDLHAKLVYHSTRISDIKKTLDIKQAKIDSLKAEIEADYKARVYKTPDVDVVQDVPMPAYAGAQAFIKDVFNHVRVSAEGALQYKAYTGADALVAYRQTILDGLDATKVEQTVVDDITLLLDNSIKNNTLTYEAVQELTNVIDSILENVPKVNTRITQKVLGELVEPDQSVLKNQLKKLEDEYDVITTVLAEHQRIQEGLRVNNLKAVSIMDQLDTLEDTVAKVREYAAGFGRVEDTEITAATKAYTMKLAQIEARFKLYDNEHIIRMIEDMRNHGDLAQALNIMLQELMTKPEAASELEAFVRVFLQTEAIDKALQLYNRILMADLDHDIRHAWMDALERQAKTSVNLATGQRSGYVLSDMLANIENYINSATVKPRTSLDALDSREGREIQEFVLKHYGEEVAQLNSHDAVYDVAKTHYLLDKLGKGDLASEGFIIDIETTGVSSGDVITQLAYRNPKTGEIKSLRAKPPKGAYPDRETLVKLLGIDDELAPGYSTPRLMELYDASYADATLTEKEILQVFIDDLSAFDGKLKLIGHNISDFDLQKIKSRITHQLSPKVVLPSTDVVDTLPLYKEKMGYFALNDDQKKLIGDTMLDYIDSLRDGHYTHMIDHWMNTNKLPADFKPPSLRFIEAPDRLYAKALSDIDSSARLRIRKGSSEFIQAGVSLAQSVGNISTSIRDHLSNVRQLNRAYSEYYIDADEAARYIGGEYSVDEYTANITALLQSGNVDVLSTMPQFLGFQTLAVKTAFDKEALGLFYRTTDWSSVELVAKQRTLRRLKFFRDAVTDWKLFDTLDIEVMRNYIRQQSPDNMEGFLVDSMDKRTIYAIAAELYHRQPKMKRPPKDWRKYLDNPLLLTLLSNAEVRRVLANWQYFTPTHSTWAVRQGYAYHTEVKNMQTEMDVLNKTMSLREKYGIHAPKLYTTVTMMTEGYELFDLMDELVQTGTAKYLDDAVAMAEYLGGAMEALDEIHIGTAQSLVERLVSAGDEAVLSYLYHNAFGVVAIHRSVVERMKDGLDHVISLATRMKDQGLELVTDKDTLYLYLSNTKDWSDTPYIPIKDVTAIQPNYRAAQEEARPFLEASVAKANAIRSRIATYAPNSIGSAYERIGRDELTKIYDKLPKHVVENALGIEHFAQRDFFATTNYNFSLLGDFAFKKTYMPFISANPYKNMYTALRELAERNDTVMKYTSALMDNTADLSSPLFSKYTPNELYDILKNQREFRVGMLVEDKVQGYKLKQVRIFSPKDVAFAMREGAMVMPVELYNKAASVINDYRFTNATVRWFDRYIAGPQKLGQLASTGFLVRNIIDSTIKNIANAESLDIIPHTLEMFKQYMAYTQCLQEITSDLVHFNKNTIKEYFAKGSTPMTQAQFEFIHEFINDGASGGMSRVLEEYMNDTYKLLHRKVPTENGLDKAVTPELIQRYIHGGDIIKDPSNYVPVVYEMLAYLDREYVYTLNARMMRQHTRNVDLHIDNLILFQKRPALIPDELRDEWVRLQKFVEEGQALKEASSLVYDSIAVKGLMSVNGVIEHVSRLSAYTYELAYRGGSKSSAAHTVLRTHFDPHSKTLPMKALEMLFPFITFGFRNAMFWSETTVTRPWLLGILRDVAMPIADLDSYTPWDLEHRMSLQYQILSGNIVLNKESGLNLKINPSYMDAFKLLYDPVGMVTDKLNAIAKAPVNIVKALLDDNMDSKYRNKLIARQALSMVPLAGAPIVRAWAGVDAAVETKSVLPMALPSMFGRTKLPPERLKYNRWVQRQAYRNTRRKTRRKYVRKSYGRKVYPASKAAYNAVKFKRITNVPGYALFMRRLGRDKSFYTKKGANKIMLLSKPTNNKNLQYKMALLWRRW